ncbi:terpene synthase family protein [Streptomyces sp. YIM 121038]|uniref:terpene synthase family protein n=1 Tax=Streptomyces sp. YIM 121038 TaxID=2136401 RepID=UPI001110900B|nr:terpene synthase family protein [Streptomyces sp. YIM 121038]
MADFLPFPNAEAKRWMLECRYPMWDSLVFPRGLAQRVAHSSQMTSLMFEVDDIAILQQALFRNVADAWGADHPYGAAFADVLAKFERNMPERLYKRYLQTWQDWSDAVLRENGYRRSRELPDFDTYLDLRRVSVGLLPYIVTAEYVLDLDLTDLLAADPDLARAGDLAVEHGMFVNDLFSCRAECLKGDYFNAVGVLLHNSVPTLQHAVDLICDRIQQADQDRAALGERLHHRYPTPAMHTYLDTLDDFCAGNLRWSLETTRYNGTGNAWNGLRTGSVTFHHDRTAITRE